MFSGINLSCTPIVFPVKFTESSRVSVPWLLLAKDPEEYIDLDCLPEGFLVCDPSKLMKINVNKLWHHWEQRSKITTPSYDSSRQNLTICRLPRMTSPSAGCTKGLMLRLVTILTKKTMTKMTKKKMVTRGATTGQALLLVVPVLRKASLDPCIARPARGALRLIPQVQQSTRMTGLPSFMVSQLTHTILGYWTGYPIFQSM